MSADPRCADYGIETDEPCFCGNHKPYCQMCGKYRDEGIQGGEWYIYCNDCTDKEALIYNMERGGYHIKELEKMENIKYESCKKML
jgi:hypothetical protein